MICLKTLRLIHRLSKKLNNDFNSKSLQLLKKNTKILFRISGGRAKNKEYGLGHVYHAMNLSSRLKPAEFFFLVEDYGNAIELLKKYNFKNIFPLKKGLDVKSDIEQATKFVKKNNIDILIVIKHDLITKTYVKAMHKQIKTAVISDVKKIDYQADLVINGFIGFKNTITKNRFGTRCLLGPKYQTLNKKYEIIDKPRKKKYLILATFGGFDEQNIVEILCQQLEKFLDKIKVKIILGQATPKSKLVRKIESKFPSNLKIIRETTNLKEEISNSKFGMCAGGVTSYEFASLGVPFAIICQYKHQRVTAKEWQNKKIAWNLGFPNKKTKLRIQKFVKYAIEGGEKNTSKGKSVVDGFGAKRVAKEILDLIR